MLRLELDTKVQTEHSRVLHEAGTVRPDQILKEWLNESPAIDFDSVVEFKNALIGLVNRAAGTVVGQNFVPVFPRFSGNSLSELRYRALHGLDFPHAFAVIADRTIRGEFSHARGV
jgi:hypothetical protein